MSLLSLLEIDADELYLRFAQVLHRHPERWELVLPGMWRAWTVRERILAAGEAFRKWYEEHQT